MARLDALLAARGVTKAELARRTEINPATITRWREKAPTAESLTKVANVLGCTLEELTGRATPHVPVRTVEVARDFGLDPGALNERAVAALRTFLRAISATQITPAGASSYPAKVGGHMPGMAESLVWNSLTTEQQAGLALLLDGREVEEWRMIAALELLFGSSRGPAGGGERVTGIVRAR